MSERNLEGVLKSFGLTEKEAELYIFLAKHGVLTCGEIAKGMKRHTAQIYRVLKILQSKGLVEATLEAPNRFAVVPLETVIDQRIKAKHDEAAQIEKTRNEVLSYWKNIRQPTPEPSLEKFVVIEGNSKIYSKISQMVKETKNQLSAVTTVSGLSRAEQFGVFDAASEHPLKSKIKFRFLTELSDQNVKAVKSLLKRAPEAKINLNGRHPNLGLKFSPQMVIRDEDEVLFFITPTLAAPALGKDDVCLWTNCKALVQAFSAVFEDLWQNSMEIEKKIVQLKTEMAAPRTHAFRDAETARKKYEWTVNSAKEEILMLTSPEGLAEFWEKKTLLLEERAAEGVSVKIMAPVVKDNLEAAKQLSKFCEVRHVPVNYLATTIVDGKELFQFRSSQLQEKPETTQCFDDVFYSADPEYVEMMKTALSNIWKNSQAPSTGTLESMVGPYGPTVPYLPKENFPTGKRMSGAKFFDIKPFGTITEKDVLNKIINAKKLVAKNPAKDVSRMYASMGTAFVHLPDKFNLPDMMIMADHVYKQSSFGPEDYLLVFLRLGTQKDRGYVPVAFAGEDHNAQEINRLIFQGSPAEQNIQLVKKDELQVRVHGNTLFAGWTVSIPLYPAESPKYTLPPACLLIEGYGDIKTAAFTLLHSSGFKSEIEENYFDAFVTFFHPSSKYSGPGTDGRFVRDHISTNYPPS